MNKRGIKKDKKERERYYKYSIYSLFATPLIFVLTVIPVVPVFASEDILAEVPVEEPAPAEQVFAEVPEEEGDDSVAQSEEESSDYEEAEEENLEVISEESNPVAEEEADANATEEGTDDSTTTDNNVDTESDTETATELAEDEESATQSEEESSDSEEGEESTEVLEEDQDTGTTTDETVEDENTYSDTSSEEDTSTSTEETVPPVTIDQDDTESETDTGTSTDEEGDVQGPEQSDEDSENDDSAEEETDSEDSDDDDQLVEETPDESELSPVEIVSEVTNDANRYQFGVRDCVPVGDGSFYCNDSEVAEVQVEDAVYAAPDKDGDQEIYIRLDGVSHKITDNDQDDLAPFYDPESNRLVWHRLIDGRYQIILYDLDEDEERQLTNSRFNNMEPTAYENITVWQSWIGNNWEIVLFDGASTTRLTNNESHDVAPHIRGNYIMWQTESGSEWMVSVYDRDSASIELIEAGAGTQVENPRFVLVYDSKNQNGDIETFGYDLDKKKVIPLGSTPAPVPNDLPTPDQTGEIRAIIQKPSNEEEDLLGGIYIDDETNSPPDLDTETPQVDYENSTTTPETDLVIPPLADDTATSTDLFDDTELTLDFSTSTPFIDESVEPATTTEDVDHIEDIVIQP